MTSKKYPTLTAYNGVRLFKCWFPLQCSVLKLLADTDTLMRGKKDLGATHCDMACLTWAHYKIHNEDGSTSNPMLKGYSHAVTDDVTIRYQVLGSW